MPKSGFSLVLTVKKWLSSFDAGRQARSLNGEIEACNQASS